MKRKQEVRDEKFNTFLRLFFAGLLFAQIFTRSLRAALAKFIDSGKRKSRKQRSCQFIDESIFLSSLYEENSLDTGIDNRMTRSATSNTTSGFRQIGCRRFCLRLPIYVKSWVFLSHKSPYKAANFSTPLLRISLVGSADDGRRKNGNINYRIDYQGFPCKLKAREKKSYRAERSKNQLKQSGRVGDCWVRHSRVIDLSAVLDKYLRKAKSLRQRQPSEVSA